MRFNEPVTDVQHTAGPSRDSDHDPRGMLEQRLATATATIGVVGLGYVGLPLAVEYASRGFDALGFDLDEDRVRKLNRGENFNEDIDDATLRELVEADRLWADSDPDRLSQADVLYICVPTPVTDHKDPDTAYIESATHTIAEQLRPGQLVVLKSTTYPGTTDDLVRPILEEAGELRDLRLGRDWFLAYSPERIDPGNAEYTTENTPVVVGGVTEACGELARSAIEAVVDEVHLVSNPRTAEMEKLLENIFRSVNIALVNEMAQLCDRMGDVNIWEVIDAAATKPFGYMPFYPGPGLGGHCIPIDPYYLSWVARKHDFETSFITLSAETNEEMPFYVEQAVIRAIAEQPTTLAEAEVLILGVAFKPNVDDTRHSPAFRIIDRLEKRGVRRVDYADPHVEEVQARVDGTTIEKESVDVSPETLSRYDAAVIVTDHDAFPYGQIAEHSTAVIDCRNALSEVARHPDHYYLLGGGE